MVGLKHGRQENVDGFRVHNAIGELIGLLRDQASPNGIAFGPDLLSFVIESAAQAVDHDAKGNGVEPRDDAAIEFRRAGIHGHRVKAFGIADGFCALVEQVGERRAIVIGRASHDEVIGGISPVALEPFQICFEATGGHDHGAAANDLRRIAVFQAHTIAFETHSFKAIVFDE